MVRRKQIGPFWRHEDKRPPIDYLIIGLLLLLLVIQMGR